MTGGPPALIGDWSGRRVLVTGHTGFKGAWLSLWLRLLGADVHGLSLPAVPGGAHEAFGAWPAGSEHLVDVRDADAVTAAVAAVRPDVVLHLAAQALVRLSYREPAMTYATNVLGTLHVLEAAAAAGARAVVVVTSDKVYANPGTPRAFVESDRLGGADPYSSSKACAELVVESFRVRCPLPVATARAGNVIGGGDRGEERLLVDVQQAVAQGRPVELRNPAATRPWQFVLDPVAGYLALAEALLTDADSAPPAVNFGPHGEGRLQVASIVEQLCRQLEHEPGWVQQPGDHPHEAPTLSLDATLAERALGWRPRVGTDEALTWTADWWAVEAAAGDLRALAQQQIDDFWRGLR